MLFKDQHKVVKNKIWLLIIHYIICKQFTHYYYCAFRVWHTNMKNQKLSRPMARSHWQKIIFASYGVLWKNYRQKELQKILHEFESLESMNLKKLVKTKDSVESTYPYYSAVNNYELLKSVFVKGGRKVVLIFLDMYWLCVV